MSDLSFDDPDHLNVVMTFDLKVNGPSPDAGGAVTFAKNATQAVKAAAVRDFVNAHIQSYEPGIPALTNANIQISGLPV